MNSANKKGSEKESIEVEGTEVTNAVTKKKKWLKRIFYGLIVILIILIIALIYYLLTQRLIIQMIPGAPKAAPRYVESIYGDFGSLTGMAVNKNGTRVYAVDSLNRKVWVFDRDGKTKGSFGKKEEPGQMEGFVAPLFVAVAPNNDVYITDREGYRILIYSPLGEFKRYFIPEPGEVFIWSPLAIDIDDDGLIYLTDAQKDNHRVLVFKSDGKLVREFGTKGSAKGAFNYPNGIAVDKDGQIYVADSSNARVQAFENKGKYLFSFRAGSDIEITHPVGINAKRSGEILVVESFGHEVQVFDDNGNFLYVFGEMGIGDGNLMYPQGIAVAPDGRVFVADRQNNRIQIWQY